MKFRVLQIDNEFFPQNRTLFGWKSIDDSREEPYSFESLEEAKSFIDKLKKDINHKPKKIIHSIPD